ncbi:ubiquinone/menaquinone biosynthesis methyltransferase [Thermodesulfovibrio sp.]|uniref:ubiquinone/menaquinone biosynthesis methyltransferase n=1 Tax=Thermodesulfovibrio sp. TaxID=2067987 RepID=UPI0030A5F704
MNETEKIRLMFDRIVHKYDFLNRLLSLGQDIYWRKRMAKITLEGKPKLVLDLAAGTADSAKVILKENVKVIGADISFEMLYLGKEKLKDKKNYIATVASGYHLPFRDFVFDVVTCAFGIRNMHKTQEALKEIYRVIKKDGRVVILEFSLPENSFKHLYVLYLKRVVPFMASLFSNRSAYEYLAESIENFYRPREFLRLLEESGFRDTKAYSLSFGCVHLYIGVK